MTKHTAETHAVIGFESEATAKVGAKGETHLNMLGQTDEEEAALQGHRLVPMNREQRRAVKRKRK